MTGLPKRDAVLRVSYENSSACRCFQPQRLERMTPTLHQFPSPLLGRRTFTSQPRRTLCPLHSIEEQDGSDAKAGARRLRLRPHPPHLAHPRRPYRPLRRPRHQRKERARAVGGVRYACVGVAVVLFVGRHGVDGPATGSDATSR